MKQEEYEIEETYEFEIPDDAEFAKETQSSLTEAETPVEIDNAEEFDIIYSDDGVEDLLMNDEVTSFEAGFMHGYLEEAEEES